MFFFDEARFGLLPCVGRVWCRRGVKPIASVKPGYSNLYSYTAVNIETGDEFSLLLPHVNTEMMNLYLEHFKKELQDHRVIIVMDQAGWHKSQGLKIPDNIEIVFLPAYSPELNPVERLWQWLKRHFCRNRLFDDLDDLTDTLISAWTHLSPFLLSSICHCNYLEL